MDPGLQTFEKANKPFSQFVNSYSVANSDPETRRQYDLWKFEAVLHQMELNAEKAESKAEGKAEGKIEIARKLIDDKISVDKIALYTGLSIEEIDKLRDQENTQISL